MATRKKAKRKRVSKKKKTKQRAGKRKSARKKTTRKKKKAKKRKASRRKRKKTATAARVPPAITNIPREEVGEIVQSFLDLDDVRELELFPDGEETFSVRPQA